MQTTAFLNGHIPAGRGRVAPPDWEVGGLIGLTLIAALLFTAGIYGVVNLFAPLGLGIILGAASWTVARRNPEFIWTPLFAFRIATIGFISIGSLVPYISPPDVVDYIMALYSYTPGELAKTNLIWAAYTATVMATVRLASLFRPVRGSALHAGRPLRGWTAIGVGTLFFAVGFGVVVLVSLGSALGVINIVVPAALMLPFEAASGVGIFLIAYHGIARGGWWYFVVAVVLVLNLVLGLILFAKTLVIFSVLFVGLALLAHRVSVWRVLIVTAALLVALMSLQPAISQARLIHMDQYGAGQIGGGIAERLGYALSYWTEGSINPDEQGNGLSRLSHVAIGSYLVTEHDLGMNGRTIEAAAYALIPRFLWPEKPVITAASNELSYRVTGQYTNALSPTTAGDIYWNFGWPGLFLLTPLVGIALWWTTLRSFQIIAVRDWFMMPFVLVSYRMGLAVDAGFVIGIFVPTIAAIIAYHLLRLAKLLLSAEREHRPTGLRYPAAARHEVFNDLHRRAASDRRG